MKAARLAALACALLGSNWAFAGDACCPLQDNPFTDQLRLSGAALEPQWITKLPDEVRSVARRVRQDAGTTPTEANTPSPPRLPTDAELWKDLDPKHRADLENDVKLGEEVAKQVEKEFKFSASANMEERLQRIGRELAAIANANQVTVSWGDKRLNPFSYEFKLLEGDDVNAFSIPGGFIYVYEGLMSFAETDHELAGVLAHEIAHASFRHVATLQREQSRLNAITLPLILIGLLSGSEAGMGAAQVGSLTNQAVGSGWNVRAEKSADLGGFQYMRKSRWEPVGLLTFMERLAHEERMQGTENWGIFRTHPPSRERVRELLNMMNAAGLPVRRSVSSTTFRGLPIENTDGTHSVKIMKRVILTLGGADQAARAEQIADKLSKLYDQVPSVREIEGRADGSIIAFREPLFQLTEADAAQANKTLSALTDQVVRDLKAVAFELRYRLADN